MGILLTLLNIIAFTLLFLLALIILILLTVLLVPIRYDLKLKYRESFWCSLSVSWLLKIVKFEVNYDKELSTKLKIFGMDFSNKAKDLDKEDEDDFYEESFSDEDSFDEGQLETEDKKDYEESDKETFSGEENSQEPDEGIEEKSIVENIEDARAFIKKKRKKKKQSFSSFIKNKYEKIKTEVKTLLKKKDRIVKLFNNESLRRGIKKIWQALVKILKLFRARKLSGRLILGFEDPYTTGQVLSYAALFYCLYKDKIELIPVFDKAIIDIDIRAKGGVRLMPVVIIATKLWFDKDFKKVYKLYKNRNKIL